MNLTADSFDHLIRYLQIPVTAKAKPDANPNEQIPDNMKEKEFKAEKGKSYYSDRFLWRCTDEGIF